MENTKKGKKVWHSIWDRGGKKKHRKLIEEKNIATNTVYDTSDFRYVELLLPF